FALFRAHESAGNKIGAGDELAGLLMDRHDGEHHAVFRQMTPIPDDDVTDVAHAFAVDKNFADLNGRNFSCAMGGQFQHVAVFENKTILFRDTDVLCKPSVAHQMAILTVDRHEIARPGEL